MQAAGFFSPPDGGIIKVEKGDLGAKLPSPAWPVTQQPAIDPTDALLEALRPKGRGQQPQRTTFPPSVVHHLQKRQEGDAFPLPPVSLLSK